MEDIEGGWGVWKEGGWGGGGKTDQKHLFEHPKWSRNNFGKNQFFRPMDPTGPTVGPDHAGPGLPSSFSKPPFHWNALLRAHTPRVPGGVREA